MDYVPYHDTNRPEKSGLYVAYTNGPVSTRADRILLMYDVGMMTWFYPMSDVRYRDHVYGCVGPLPILRLTEGTTPDDHNLRHSELA